VANLPYLPYAERPLHPELAGEPSDSVYAPGDGLGPYRRLLAAARTRLASDGLLALQFRGDLVSASAAELPALELFVAERAA